MNKMKLALALLFVLIPFSVGSTPLEIDSSKKYDEVKDYSIPPWSMYPELKYGSVGWRMGYGEHYILRWNNFFSSLNSKGREEYKARNPEPEEWTGFYQLKEKGIDRKNKYENKS